MELRIIVTQFALILQYFQFMIYLLINREEEGILGYVGPDVPHLSRRCSQIVDRADLGSTALGAMENPLPNLLAACVHLLLQEVLGGGHCGKGGHPKSRMKKA